MIKKIYHIADVHIPNKEDKRPYSEMLKRFLAEMYNDAKQYQRDEIRIVIVGDLFHQKIRISNEALSMFHEMLNYLDAIGKTYIIAGNHDMLENNQSREDSLTPTFKIKNTFPDIIYMDKALDYKSGYIVDDNVIWALYSMFDKFNRPNIDDLKEQYPDSKIIGLYHGEIVGATTDSGRMCENGIPFEDFIGCDCVMAGHIHKFQEIRKNGVPIVYAGSLFQQDKGENTTGHGFLVWDLETMKYTHHEVTNDYRIFHYNITSYEDVQNDEEHLLNL